MKQIMKKKVKWRQQQPFDDDKRIETNRKLEERKKKTKLKWFPFMNVWI